MAGPLAVTNHFSMTKMARSDLKWPLQAQFLFNRFCVDTNIHILKTCIYLKFVQVFPDGNPERGCFFPQGFTSSLKFCQLKFLWFEKLNLYFFGFMFCIQFLVGIFCNTRFR